MMSKIRSFTFVFFCGAVVVAWSIAPSYLFAQFRGGGGGGSGMSGFIERADANGNGSIDPNELEGRTGYFLKRILERSGSFDLSKPIRISEITKAFERMRAERERGGSPFGRGGDRGDRERGERSRGDRSGRFGGRSSGGDRSSGGSRYGRSSSGDRYGGRSSGGDRYGRRSSDGRDRSRSGGDRYGRRDDRREVDPNDSRAQRANDPREERSSYRFSTAEELSPDNLPSWFLDSDFNKDGQIMMPEFAAYWTNEIAEEFVKFDLNGDGVITADECLDAGDNGASRSSASLDAVPRSAPSLTGAPAAPKKPPKPAMKPLDASEISTLMEKMGSRYQNYYKKQFTKNDANSDGKLGANEQVELKGDTAAADSDKDGELTFEEYAAWRYRVQVLKK